MHRYLIKLGEELVFYGLNRKSGSLYSVTVCCKGDGQPTGKKPWICLVTQAYISMAFAQFEP